MNNKITQNKNFETFDLGCAAALVADKFKLVSLNKENPKKVLFCFQHEPDIYDAVEDYFSSNFKIDAQAYFNCIKSLKNRLYSG